MAGVSLLEHSIFRKKSQGAWLAEETVQEDDVVLWKAIDDLWS